jgi:GT2 family glycosyltransferase
MTKDMPPRILVIIVNYRTPEMTLRAVNAAVAALPDGGEVLLIDNGSGDGSAEVLQDAVAAPGMDPVRFIRSPRNGGFGAGNNIGFNAGMADGSEPDFFYLLNSDAFPEPGCIETLLRHMQRNSRIGIAGSHLRGLEGDPHISAFRFPGIASEFEGAARIGPITRLLHRFVVAPPLPHHAMRTDWVAGASVLLRAEMLRQIGWFDETYFLYFEETDLCLRAARAGWECWYLPEARAEHVGSATTGLQEKQRRVPGYWFESRRHYFRKSHGSFYATLALLARLGGGVLHRLRCALTGREVEDPPHFLRDLLRFELGLHREDGRKLGKTIAEDGS